MRFSRYTIALVLVLALAEVACAGMIPAVTPVPPVDRESAEYEVYSALIRDHYISGQVGTVVILDYTQGDIDPNGDLTQRLAYISQQLTLDQMIRDDFLARNAESHPLQNGFKLPVPVVLLSQAERDDLFKKGGQGWDGFYARYPHSQGLLTLSAAGFDANMDRALVYVGNQSHYLAGTGYYVLLDKQDGAWVFQNEVMAWIS